jgi:hypothetical protein
MVKRHYRSEDEMSFPENTKHDYTDQQLYDFLLRYFCCETEREITSVCEAFQAEYDISKIAKLGSAVRRRLWGIAVNHKENRLYTPPANKYPIVQSHWTHAEIEFLKMALNNEVEPDKRRPFSYEYLAACLQRTVNDVKAKCQYLKTAGREPILYK